MDWTQYKRLGALKEVIEGRMEGKRTRGRRRKEMLDEVIEN